MREGDISAFKNRKVRAKTIFCLGEIDKSTAYTFVKKHHYLGDAKFFAIYSIGLFVKDTTELVGVASYANPQGNVSLKGWFGLDNKNKSVLELSRLCLIPELNGTNATSYLLANSMKIVHKNYGIRAIITLADNNRHVGSIYQVCNFRYYGLTDEKKDFYRYVTPTEHIAGSRGKTKGCLGVWLPRSRKHRYAYIMDDNLECLYEPQNELPNKNTYHKEDVCRGCQGRKIVVDTRLGTTYSCPICTKNLVILG